MPMGKRCAQNNIESLVETIKKTHQTTFTLCSIHVNITAKQMSNTEAGAYPVLEKMDWVHPHSGYP